MKLHFLSFFTLVILGTNLLTGCKSRDQVPQAPAIDSTAAVAELVVANDTRLLIEDLAENGDYVNSREFPSLIKASAVMESMEKNIHIIDLRKPEVFAQGHISKSVN
ncbi:MAG: rhodanese-like domain-containing protein, partial [Alphaproteobacteria bacterium]